MLRVQVSPPNSVLLISDRSQRNIPLKFSGSIFAATDSCIAVGCRSADDGPTEVIFAKRGEFEPTGSKAFSSSLFTPDKTLQLSTVLNEVVLEVPLTDASTQIDMYVNDETEPDRIEVIFS
jgi:hypothetical protein